jgi:tetratricopeptide (TPR) repeat protein
MPLEVISSSQALHNIRTNAHFRWPKRGAGDNRIEPIASPAFTPGFSFRPGCEIFTIGSCFARNIEAALESLGFRISNRRFFAEAGDAASDGWALNNYGVPAIYNEIAWALGELPYSPDDNLVEIRPGLHADLHLSAPVGAPPEPRETVLARRRRLLAMTRSILTADVLVVTLGLAEVWRDSRSGLYLNAKPPTPALVAEPERFELHILSHDDVREYLDRTFELIFRRCRPDMNVILTLSPVPLSATFTGGDVAVANQYSKSVLRAAVEAVVRRHDRVDYFPSYESVILSDRARAWEDDLTHVRWELIDHNVSRMIAAYTGMAPAPPAADASAALATANQHRRLALARESLGAGRFEAALREVEPLMGGALDMAAVRVRAAAWLGLGEAEAAEGLLRSVLAARPHDGGLHGLLGRALLMRGQAQAAVEALAEAVAWSPRTAAWSVLLARTLIAAGESTRAEAVVDQALLSSPDSAPLQRLRAAFGR